MGWTQNWRWFRDKDEAAKDLLKESFKKEISGMYYRGKGVLLVRLNSDLNKVFWAKASFANRSWGYGNWWDLSCSSKPLKVPALNSSSWKQFDNGV